MSVLKFFRFNRLVALTLLVTFTSASLAQEATIRVTRKDRDQYAVSKTEVVITTKYCHEYARDDEAVLSASKPNDSKFNLLDFLIQLGLMVLTKGASGPPKLPTK
jgi:hypothetical protein